MRHAFVWLTIALLPGWLTAAEQAPAPPAWDWIVSVRHCPEKRTADCPCGFVVHRLDECGTAWASSFDELLASLQPGVPVCCVIHGSFVSWPETCAESRLAQSWLRCGCPGRPLHAIFFSWPSDETSKVLFPVDIAVLGRRAARHGQDIAQLIGSIPNDHPISLIGHSHGARMVAATLHLLSGGSIDGVCAPASSCQNHRIRAVFVAAALDHEWLNPGEPYDRAVYTPEGILNLQNHRDAALALYPLYRVGAAQALGRTGITEKDASRLGGWQAKVLDVDVTPYVGRSHFWTRYLERPEIAQIISPYVFFHDGATFASQ